MHFAVNLLITILMKNKFLLYIYTLISFLLILLYFDHLPTYAQEKEPGYDATIVVLMSINYRQIHNEAFEGFKKALQAEDIQCNYEILDISNEEDSNDNLINEIYGYNPDLILTFGTSAVSKILDIKDIPVVFSMVLNTNFYKIDQNETRDNKNITGVILTVSPHDQFSIYKQIIPKLQTIGVVYNLEENEQFIIEARQAANELDIELIAPDVTSEKAALRSVNNLISFIDAIWLIVDYVINSTDAIKRISLEGFGNNIPVMAPSIPFAPLAAIAVSADYEDIGRQSGDIAVRVIRGIPPSSISVESPQKLNICINKNTMDAIGLVIPDSIGIHNIIIK